MTQDQPHPVPMRYHRAWKRECPTCGYKCTDQFPLTITIKCSKCGATMHQANQGTPPDIETVTEWGTCGVDAVCPDHREPLPRRN